MRRTIGLSIAVGLFVLGHAAPARAQVSYGYDSYNLGNYQPSMTYYYTSGYSRMYTDPSNGMGGNGFNVAGPQTVAPYVQPPFGSFGSGGRLPSVYAQGPAATVARAPARAVAPAKTVVQPAPRGPLKRLLRRR
jgi:hypothetical protein